MSLAETLRWPFFDAKHRDFAEKLSRWAADNLHKLPHDDVDEACRSRVKALGEAGFLTPTVPGEFGGMYPQLDVRTLCLAREILGFHDGLADFAFAMQGLGTGSITLYGTPELKQRYLPRVREGKATPDGNSHVRLDGRKTWISNGGIADHYVVFARTGEAPGARGLSAFMVDADAPGLSVEGRIEVIAPHPLATLKFDNVRIPVANRLGAPGEGFKVAMATLDIFRSTVGAAALGFARRALHEMTKRAATRKLFGAPLGDLQLTQSSLADSITDVDTSALLVYRAAWTKDNGAARVTSEAAMAKMHSTESAQRVIDRAVQLFGGQGVTKGNKVEELYREIRALRIYEGATEVQKVVIAREALKNFSAGKGA
jgi:acyl-CoA dehydrogenase